MSSIITVENISKKYIIGHQKQERYTALRDVLANGAKSLVHKLRHPFSAPAVDPEHEEFWALKDVSFDIQQGDRVGIVGRNGAGKSTLLKILSRITEPTSGRISIKGRVASLLEVGTGFHPELTGRENIFLNGAILGMSKVEIKSKFDEIVAFAEVERFLDTPVKRYSSGMYVRLAFAVAAHLEPEILIVDEVLAVGDSQFQKKCMGKMQDVSGEGRTIIFVSHNLTAIRSLCNRAILLNMGEMCAVGDVDSVTHQYQQVSVESNAFREWKDIATAPGNQNGWFKCAEVESVSSDQRFQYFLSSSISLNFTYQNLNDKSTMHFNILLYNQDGVIVFNTGSNPKCYKQGLIKVQCHIPSNLLNDGAYSVRMIVHYSGGEGFDAKEILTFEVQDEAREGWLGKWTGVIRPNLEWTTRQVEDI